MGMLRLYLALAVVLDHVMGLFDPSGTALFGFRTLSGSPAVETFFAISGFYMGLILNKKYIGPGSTHTFYVNRFTRIYPIYWAITGGWLLFELLRYFFTGHSGPLLPWTDFASTLHPGTLLLLSGVNFSIVGLDATYFLHFTDLHGALAWGDPYHWPSIRTLPAVSDFCLNPPAWSISLELLFYLLAPFLARRPVWQIALVAAISFGLKLWLLFVLKLGIPYTYRFFPSELHVFLLGILAYRCQSWFALERRDSKWLFGLVILYGIGTVILPFTIGVEHPLIRVAAGFLFTLISVAMLPILFHLFSRKHWDIAIGELSYPVYLVHWLLRMPLLSVAAYLGLSASAGILLAVFMSVIAAYLLNRFLIEPIEGWRAAYYKRRQALREIPTA